MATVYGQHKPWKDEKQGTDGYYKSEAWALFTLAEAEAAKAAPMIDRIADADKRTAAGAEYGRAKNALDSYWPAIKGYSEPGTAWEPIIRKAQEALNGFKRITAGNYGGTAPVATTKKKGGSSARSEGSTITTTEVAPSIPVAAPDMPLEPAEWTGPFGLSKRATIGIGVGLGVLLAGGIALAFTLPNTPSPAPVAGIRSRKRWRR